MALPLHSDHSTCSIGVPLLVLAFPIIQTTYMELWTEYKAQVSHIVPPLPLPTLISPYISLQALSICLPHHILHPYLNSPFRLYTCPPLPLLRFFLSFRVTWKGIHSLMHVLPCIYHQLFDPFFMEEHCILL
jgi:hypothetical protein